MRSKKKRAGKARRRLGWRLKFGFFPAIFQTLHLDGTVSLPTHTHILKFVAIYRNGLRGNVLRHVFFSAASFDWEANAFSASFSWFATRKLLNLLLIHCESIKNGCISHTLCAWQSTKRVYRTISTDILVYRVCASRALFKLHVFF